MPKAETKVGGLTYLVHPMQLMQVLTCCTPYVCTVPTLRIQIHLWFGIFMGMYRVKKERSAE